MTLLPPRPAPIAFPSPSGLLASWLLGGLAAAWLGAMPAAALAAPTYRQRVLASGLKNPRGLTLAGHRLLVSEAGQGGARQSSGGSDLGSNCIRAGSGAELCYGLSGAIGAWDFSSQTYSHLLTGLPSLARADGSEGTGIADLTVGGPTGLLGVFGLGGDPGQASLANLGSDLFGQVVSLNLADGTIQARQNLALFELTSNPDGRSRNSNPYALELFGGKLYATDAGGNTLVSLDPNPTAPDGSFPILDAYVLPGLSVNPGPSFPLLPNPYPAEPVPTGLAVDPTGQQLRIGELSGFPFVPGSANLYATDGQSPPSLSLTGFSLITALASGADGSLYVLEYASNFFSPLATGSLWRVDPDGTRTQIVGGLHQPTGLAVADDGSLYVANNGDGLEGQLLEVRPEVPAPLPLLGAAAAWGQARRLRRRAAGRHLRL